MLQTKQIATFYRQHRSVVLTTSVLIVTLLTAFFLYINVFLALQDLTKLYEQQGAITFSVLDTTRFDRVYEALEEKRTYEIQHLNTLRSPFTAPQLVSDEPVAAEATKTTTDEPPPAVSDQ